MAVASYSQRTVTVYTGLSTDTKPATAQNGDRFLQTDDAEVFVWTGAAWTQITGSNILVVI
jgi:hypothetical protein